MILIWLFAICSHPNEPNQAKRIAASAIKRQQIFQIFAPNQKANEDRSVRALSPTETLVRPMPRCNGFRRVH